MAKKKPSRARSKKQLREQEAILRQTVRQQAQKYLSIPGVTSVGVGFKLDEKGRPTDELCIQFTVGKRLSLGHRTEHRVSRHPQAVKNGGLRGFPVDHRSAFESRKHGISAQIAISSLHSKYSTERNMRDGV